MRPLLLARDVRGAAILRHIRSAATIWTAAAVAFLVALFAIDLLIGDELLLAPLYGLAALVAGLRAGVGATLIVGVASVLLAVLSLAMQTSLGASQDAVRLVTVLSSAAIGLWAALLRERLRRQEARQRVLARAAAIVAPATDPIATLERMARAAVPEIADWCAIDLARRGGAVERVAVAHADADVDSALRDAGGRPPTTHDLTGPGAVIRTGEPSVALDLAAGDGDAAAHGAFAALGVRSLLVVPLRVRDRTLGAMSLAGTGRRRLAPADVQTAGDLAARAAQMLEQARLLDEMRDTQRRLSDAFGLLDVLFERAPIGLAFFDRDLRYERVNDRLAEINGVPAAAHVGRRVSELLPEMDATVEADLTRVLEHREPLIDLELRGATPASHGRPRDFLVSYFPVLRGAQEVIGVGVLVQDITDRRAGERALRAQTDRYETLLLALSEAGEGMLVLEGEHVAYANQAFQTMSGYGFDELRALRSIFELVVPEDRAGARERAGLRDEQALTDPHYALRLRRRDGRDLDLEVAGVPLQVEDRRQLVIIVRDVTARRRDEQERERLLAAERQARTEAEAGRRRARFLAEASAAFERSLDLRRAAELTAQLPLAEHATMAAVLLTPPGDVLRLAAVGARDDARAALLRRVFEQYPLHERAPGHPLVESARSGVTVRVDDGSREGLWPLTVDAGHVAMLEELDPGPQVAIPLRARGRTLGSVIFELADPPEDAAGAETVALLEEFCGRAALALDNARLYEERTHVAQTLQRSLLPTELPDIPGVEIHARYLPAGEGNEVGGDFYDGFALTGDEWALVIGDVCGKGAEAAAITALARYTTRAAVLHTRRPARVLAELNEALLRQHLDLRFCTVSFAAIRPLRSGAHAVRLASGGHPLPVIVRASGEVAYAGRPGTLLGVVSDPDLPEDEIVLDPGDALVLYTDGVVEASPLDDALGPDAFAAFLAGQAGADAATLALAIERAVLDVQGGGLRDDVAILVLRVEPA